MTSNLQSSPRFANRLTEPIRRFMAVETSSSILLLLATIIALVWANLPGEWSETYHSFWSTVFTFGIGQNIYESHGIISKLHEVLPIVSLSLEAWVNDALMAIFFFVVGMEIKRELSYGELASMRRAMLPVMGALGGMIVPAGIYFFFHQGTEAVRGWGIPMATDIAFAVAALSIFGNRVPASLKVFLLALAIVDDLGAVAVIAIFYSEHLVIPFLLGAGVMSFVILLFQRVGVRSYIIYIFLGAVTWYMMLRSGVHATVAGVIIGFLTPAKVELAHEGILSQVRDALEELREVLQGEDDDHGGHHRHDVVRRIHQTSRDVLSPLDFLTNLLHPWVAFVIMPVFALANAGVHLDMSTIADPVSMKIALAVGLGLLVGKPIGVTLLSFIAVKVGIASLPRGVSWKALFAVGVLAGIGFTMALFVTALAFSNEYFIAGSKIGILAGSVSATLIGVAILARTLPPAESSGK